MGKRLSSFYLILSILVFAFIIIWPAGRFYTLRSRNIETSRTVFTETLRRLKTNYEIFGDFSSPLFQESVRKQLETTPGLEGVVIHSPQNGIEYLLSKRPGIILSMPDQGGQVSSLPEYDTRSLQHIVVSAPMGLTSGSYFTVDGIFVVVDRAQLFPLFRDTLIIAGCFFLITLVFLIVYSTPREQRQQPASAPKPARPAKSAAANRSSPSSRPVLREARKSSGEEGLFSPETGIGWESLLESRLSFELRRTASFDQDLVLAVMKVKDTGKGDKLYRIISQILIESFPFKDLLFEYDQNGFAVVLPNIDLDQGTKDLEKCMKKIHETATDRAHKISVGLASRNGRLMSGKRLINEATSALNKASKDRKSAMIAFRPDPVKYREYIASKL